MYHFYYYKHILAIEKLSTFFSVLFINLLLKFIRFFKFLNFNSEMLNFSSYQSKDFLFENTLNFLMIYFNDILVVMEMRIKCKRNDEELYL